MARRWAARSSEMACQPIKARHPELDTHAGDGGLRSCGTHSGERPRMSLDLDPEHAKPSANSAYAVGRLDAPSPPLAVAHPAGTIRPP
jgi:hypothetical protein